MGGTLNRHITWLSAMLIVDPTLQIMVETP